MLLEKLLNLLSKELLEANAITEFNKSIINIDENNKNIKYIVDNIDMLPANKNQLTQSTIKDLKKNCEQSIKKLKNIKFLIDLAKKYSQKNNVSFKDHSLMPSFKKLNTIFNKQVTIDGLEFSMQEMIYNLKTDSKNLQKTFDLLNESNLEKNTLILQAFSSLNLYTVNIISDISTIKEIIETKKNKE